MKQVEAFNAAVDTAIADLGQDGAGVEVRAQLLQERPGKALHGASITRLALSW